MNTSNTLWLIDDDPALRLILEDTFSDAGLNVIVFSQAKGAWTKLNDILQGHVSEEELPEVILTDIRMPMMDGLSFSEWVHKHFPEIPIIIMTAHSDLKSAVDSYQTGAFDYLPKPFDLDDAVTIIKKAIKPKSVVTINPDLDSHSLNNNVLSSHSSNNSASNDHPSNDRVSSNSNADSNTKNSANKDNQETTNKASISPKSVNPTDKHATQIPANTTNSNASKSSSKRKKTANQVVNNGNPSGIIGQSVAMQTVFRAIGRLSKSPITVLITGESGTGKELVAGALHQHSPRREHNFIALNMAAIPHDLIESELFGHEKGAFTGATTMRQGRFEQADGGTLFLDEIGDMPFSTQTRLLRVLANGEFFRVGGQKPIQVDVRIIAATHQNLEDLVKQGKFREDLFYRLNVIRLPLPPLRERPEDIPALTEFFLQQAATEMNSSQKQLSPEAMALMQAFTWSGNVRQLENACRWITVMATGDLVMIDDLPPELLEFAHSHAEALNSQLNDTNTPTYNDSSAYLSSHTLPTQDSHDDTPTNTPLDGIDIPNLASPYLATRSQSLPATNTWQQALKIWVDNALQAGKTDILQIATPEFERILIEVALKHSNGRKGEAADLLGWGRNTLTRKIQQLEQLEKSENNDEEAETEV